MAVKKFTPKASKQKKEPIPFELYDETFNALPYLQGTVILDFMTATSSVDGEDNNSGIVKEVLPFFEAALEPESYERFKALTKSHDKIVEFDDLMEILAWLIEQYTARPTSGSEK